MKRGFGLAVLALAAAPLAAQQMSQGHDHQMMCQGTPMHEMMAPMMQAMALTPARLLARSDSLGFTPLQVERLRALRDAATGAHDAAVAEAKTHMDAVTQALKATVLDTAALLRHARAAHTAMGTAHELMLVSAARARSLLTVEQRAKLDRWKDR